MPDWGDIRALEAGDVLLGAVAQHHMATPAVWEPGYVVDASAVEATLAQLNDLLRDGTGAVLVAESTAGMAGFCWVRALADQGEGHVASLWTDPDQRHQGVATALLHAAEDWTRARGYAVLSSNVHAANPVMIRLSEQQGFAPTWISFAKTLDPGNASIQG